MSALLGVFGPDALSARGAVPAMLATMQNRASDDPETFESPEALVAARRHRWESALSGWTGPLLIAADDWVIAADASLYYVAELRRKLEPSLPSAREAGSADLLLAALRTWGHRLGRHVEGDYSLVAYDRLRKHVLLLRDSGARRALVWTMTNDGTLVVASSPLAVVEHPRVSRKFDLAFLGNAAAGLKGHGLRTAYSSVTSVRPGTALLFPGPTPRVVDRWTPPEFASGWEESVSDDAAGQLLRVLQAATLERVQRHDVNAVWLSGGWDSTSLFAAGMSALQRGGDRDTVLAPISVTYPADDTGNEDAHIRDVSAQWGATVRWVDSGEISLLEDAERRAAVRDDPQVHPSESFIRRLCRETRALGSRAALDGAGGDHLFHVSTVAVLADHFFFGRWDELWRARGAWGSSGRTFLRYALLPHLEAGTRRWLGAVRGRPLGGFWDSQLPGWIVPTPELVGDLEPEVERQPGEGAAAFETRAGLSSPILARAVSWNHVMALEEGVLLRSPFLDPRMIAFAASRPLSDRGCGGDSKRVLRRAMRGLLPDSVLEARRFKSGTTVGHMRRQLQASRELESWFEDRTTLESLGVIDGDAIRSAIRSYAITGNHSLGAHLLTTLEADRWLKAHSTS